MRSAVRAIVIRDNHLLTMHRNKFGTEYDTLIGGGVEMGEDLEKALLREVAEETGIAVQNLRPVFIEQAGEPYGTQFIFLCDYVSGEPMLALDSEEAEISMGGKNMYEPRWLPLSEVPNTTFRSEALKQAILFAVEHGFPQESVDITDKTQYTSW